MVLKNIHCEITRSDHEFSNKHKGRVVWFTGLPSSGKTTLAISTQEYLFNKLSYDVCVIDGDVLSKGLCNDLGFSRKDRTENLRRAAEVAKILLNLGFIVLSSFITPLKKDRSLVKSIVGKEDYTEVFVKCPIEICRSRDYRYSIAEKGEIKKFTGVSSSYEPPNNPDLILDTSNATIEESVEKLVAYIIGGVK